MIHVLVLICQPRTAQPLTDELMDKFVARNITASVLMYGIMQKGLHGFIIVALRGETPADILENINQDGEVSGYIVLDDSPRQSAETEGQA